MASLVQQVLSTVKQHIKYCFMDGDTASFNSTLVTVLSFDVRSAREPGGDYGDDIYFDAIAVVDKSEVATISLGQDKFTYSGVVYLIAAKEDLGDFWQLNLSEKHLAEAYINQMKNKR